MGDPDHGDIPPVTMNFIHQYSRTFGADGNPAVFDLVPGRYEIGVGFEGHDEHSMRLDIRPSPGPVPETP